MWDLRQWATDARLDILKGMTLTRPQALLRQPTSAPIARLLWMPALGVPARKYEAFATALSTHGLSVAVHEWRGTGACPQRASFGSDWGYREWLCEDLPESLAALDAAAGDAPLLLGGHSIGGQMAALFAALGAPAKGLVIAGSGVPHWRLFPRWTQRLAVGGFALSLPLLTRLCGHYPGDRLGFAGREAGALMRDWAGTVRSGDYAQMKGLPTDLPTQLRAVTAPVLGLRFSDDWLVPPASLDALINATGSTDGSHRVLDAASLGAAADHFAWLRAPRLPAEEIARWWAVRRSSSS